MPWGTEPFRSLAELYGAAGRPRPPPRGGARGLILGVRRGRWLGLPAYCRQAHADRRDGIDAGDLADRVREVRLQAGHRHDALVIDVVVIVDAHAGRHPIELQRVPRAPSDVVIRARGVATHPEPP